MKIYPPNDVITAPSGTFRAVYKHFDLGMKGRLQEYDRENNRWITTEYCEDYPQLMRRYFDILARFPHLKEPPHWSLSSENLENL